MFTQGEIYQRARLHEQYGEQQQGGISTPSQHDIIMLFTGQTGEQYGYSDSWAEDGLFLYTGEGQVGDMTFVRGNAAVRDHLQDGKDLHLFAYVARGQVRYIGQMVCIGFHYRPGSDRDGGMREMIVFELAALDMTSDRDTLTAEPLSFQEPTMDASLAELRAMALADTANAKTPAERKALHRQRSQAIRLYALKRANGICERPFEKSRCGLKPSKPPHHEMNHRGVNHGIGSVDPVFIIFTQAAIVT